MIGISKKEMKIKCITKCNSKVGILQTTITCAGITINYTNNNRTKCSELEMCIETTNISNYYCAVTVVSYYLLTFNISAVYFSTHY